jgi:hypothetical protein
MHKLDSRGFKQASGVWRLAALPPLNSSAAHPISAHKGFPSGCCNQGLSQARPDPPHTRQPAFSFFLSFFGLKTQNPCAAPATPTRRAASKGGQLSDMLPAFPSTTSYCQQACCRQSADLCQQGSLMQQPQRTAHTCQPQRAPAGLGQPPQFHYFYVLTLGAFLFIFLRPLPLQRPSCPLPSDSA